MLLCLSEKLRENSEISTESERFLAPVSNWLSCLSRSGYSYVIAGAFGEVRMCVHRESQAQRAVKVLRKSHMDEDEKRMLFNEINILKEIVSKGRPHLLISQLCLGPPEHRKNVRVLRR